MITPIGQFRLYRWCVVMINIRGQPKTECAYESFKSFQPIFFFQLLTREIKKIFKKYINTRKDIILSSFAPAGTSSTTNTRKERMKNKVCECVLYSYVSNLGVINWSTNHVHTYA
jgi:hypothetical protein